MALTSDKKQVRIRICGIDAPEGGQAYGNKVTQYVKGLLAKNPVVEHDVKDTGRWERTVVVAALPEGSNISHFFNSKATYDVLS